MVIVITDFLPFEDLLFPLIRLGPAIVALSHRVFREFLREVQFLGGVIRKKLDCFDFQQFEQDWTMLVHRARKSASYLLGW